MKRILTLLLTTLLAAGIPAGAYASMQTPVEDSVRQARKEENRQDLKDKSEAVKEQIKDAAIDLKDEIIDQGKGLKEQAKEKAGAIKESLINVKETVTDWFNENIKANTVGDFEEMQRQNNHDFSVMVSKEWSEYPLTIRTRPSFTECGLLCSKTAAALQDSAFTLQDPTVFARPNPIPAPRPYTYFEGAGTEAVAQSVTKQYISYKFYGTEIRIYYASSLRATTLGKGKEKNVAKFWEYLAQEDFNPVLFQFYQYKEELGLNDWLYYQLIKEFAERLFVKSKHGEDLGFTVFMLNQTGYDARLARLKGEKGERLVVLLPFYEKIYDMPFVTIGNNDYYLADVKLSKKEMGSQVFCYKQAFATATLPLSLVFNPAGLRLAPLYGQFQTYVYNERIAEIESAFPAGDFWLCAEAPFSEPMSKTLLYRFKVDLDNQVQQKQDADVQHTLSERERQEIRLLALADFIEKHIGAQNKQSAKLAGRTLPADLMFHRKGSGDIQDRAVLFFQICNRILDIPAILVVHPDYILPAVALAEKTDGTADGIPDTVPTLLFEGKTYYLFGTLPKDADRSVSPQIYR